uniref:Uncharacterized protein n=1 Tax=Anopheles maculatus TaxID=74869 RepID=A0A182SLC3_9DIPT
MKMSNELTENLEVLKGNIEKIAEETSKVVKRAQNVENPAANVEPIPRQHGPVRPASSALRSRSCECFGCQSTFDEQASSRPTTSPPYGHKQFQRTLFERNPRYAKTIRKIYQLGSSERPPSSTGADRAETAKKAAQKFLQSLQGAIQYSVNSKSDGSSAGQIASSDGTDFSFSTFNTHPTQSDFGEILSPGEIK